MFIKDHNPPHFHAKYGDSKGIFGIETGEILEGELPKKTVRLNPNLHKIKPLT
ncbi:DUF4160 domain-containing protein [Litoribacter ruber]|uniref:DUF4160 domain-containing protein n=1 Tax=Litoribacter ruber TaxID=702568 RepID=UPI001BD9F770|nr:DUF4160 domain-containing protein [Litoribacter ruber]MBT0812267.1 DUF4160 domain-containing protein [Litoribacter ruber]